jgi:N-acetylglucosaminyldiphosphoundecaprenol N-acetyl-beta-D-mannosaminyltransferase
LYFNLESDFKVKCIDKKKLTFLLLHLGYGGIETSTINTANALSEKYDVELISFYNLKENQSKDLKENISVKYLYNGEPNKAEFKQAIKEKNIFKVLKEGFKAVDILAKKRYLIKNEIQNSNSMAIVSTRYDFSVILNKYGRKDIIKIAQEHHHHNNNNKYINVLKNKYKKIDYLFALTNSLKKDYEKFLVKNKHTKIVVVPNMLPSYAGQQSKLNTTNIVTTSRLHEGKRINELIDIFSQIHDTNTKLYIIGSGDEWDNLKNQITNLDLENRVIMTGYLNKQEQMEYVLNSSVFAMTSISEGLPMVLLEVMQLGIPCIAYETDSGVADIIKNNENGFIIKNRDEKKYINKLDTLLKNYDLRKSMSNNCIKTSEKFKKEKVCKIWFKILDK